jgi:Ca2+-binding EF-hand superfamily protein
MKTKPFTLAAAALVSMFAFGLPAQAQEASQSIQDLVAFCDSNKDGTVTRKEYLDAMARMWDDKHAKMMKTDNTMKAGSMNRAQFTTFMRGSFIDPGKIGG